MKMKYCEYGPRSLHPFVCLSACPSVNLSISLSVCLYVPLFICLPFVRLTYVHLLISLTSVRRPVFISVCLSFRRSICPSFSLYIHLSVHMSVRLLTLLNQCKWNLAQDIFLFLNSPMLHLAHQVGNCDIDFFIFCHHFHILNSKFLKFEIFFKNCKRESVILQNWPKLDEIII
jgi:hypothetical protein